ncbi:MAG: DEAD/DEAH box helicase [Candidatus Omnitrophica bacterium]|nr:DEAD/DEAH box helicase [Candidatus Omnitrophota bacterium]
MEKKKIKLDRFQEEAIGLAKRGYSVIVSAPTGAGKTLIAEYIIRRCIHLHQKVVYTAPIKALSNQKFRDFFKTWPKTTGILTGDVSINPGAPLLIMTTEIFRNSILVDPANLEDCHWVIFDEIHYLDDIDRGTVWEESIILLPKHIRILALSATIPNIDEFTDWLKRVHPFPVRAVVEKKRPVPLHFLFQCNNEIFPDFKKLEESHYLRKRIKQKTFKEGIHFFKANKLSTLINYLKERGALPCIYFAFSRRRCEDLASEVYSYNFLTKEEKERIKNIFLELVEKFNLGSDRSLTYLFPLIKKGIAYHHAGLLPTLKEIVERLFTTGLIKFIFTTETFALGINMPAKTVVFDNLTKFYGRYTRYLKTRDFYQMAGRAGRRGIDKEGYVFARINPHQIDLTSLREIIYGRYEPIVSQLRSCYATILNLFLIMKEKLLDIYPLSFHFYQSQELEKREAQNLLKRKLQLLKDTGYIIGNTLSGKGELASKVYSFELQIGELFESGFLESLDERMLFVIISSLVYEPRKGEKKPKLNKRIKRLKRELNLFIKEIHTQERRYRIYPLSKKFYFHITQASSAWYEGISFYKLTNFSAIDEGELVRYFRMTIQVLREMLSSKAIDTSFKSKIRNCISRVNRDVVDAEKQLRQEI